MKVISTKGWSDYGLLDSGNGLRLERFGKFVISKPDPQAIWNQSLAKSQWEAADAKFQNDTWIKKSDFPQNWHVNYKELKFLAKLTPFKHTGIFPEQSLNWDFIEEKINNQKSINNSKPYILNLFAYTGIASLVAAANGAKVTHVDASKPSIAWAKENQTLSNLLDKPIRYILDDAIEFCAREIRRGDKYDGIIMDPPVYGHGPNGELWDFNKSFPILLDHCSKLLSDKPLFVIANAYAVSASAIMLKNLFEDYFPKGNLEYGELALEQESTRLLSTGIISRLSFI
nr:class I SAM-dependent methyltransferase [Candidatus Levybacteria bacterium]